MKKVIETEEAEKKLDRAVRKGEVKRYLGADWFKEAVDKRVLTEAEAEGLREVERLVSRVIAVDDFEQAELEPHYSFVRHTLPEPEEKKTPERPPAEMRAAE